MVVRSLRWEVAAMGFSDRGRRFSGLGLVAALVVAASSAAVVFAQFRGPGPAGPGGRPRFEYLQREVETDGIADKLNDLSKEGWMVFQVVPIYSMEENGASTKAVPHSYQVFARRFVPGPPGEGAEAKKKFGPEFWKKEFFKKEFFKKEFEKRKKEEERKKEELEKRSFDDEKKEAQEPEETKDQPDQKDEA